MISGDELYDDDVTSGPILPPKPKRSTPGLFYRLGPAPTLLDVVRSQHRQRIIGTPDDGAYSVCATCYIFDEGWPCAVAQLVDILDAQLEDERMWRRRGEVVG